MVDPRAAPPPGRRRRFPPGWRSLVLIMEFRVDLCPKARLLSSNPCRLHPHPSSPPSQTTLSQRSWYFLLRSVSQCLLLVASSYMQALLQLERRQVFWRPVVDRRCSGGTSSGSV